MVFRPAFGTCSSLCVLSTVIASLSAPAHADDGEGSMIEEKWYRATAYVGAKLGDERTIGELGLLIPFAQSSRSMAFADIRGRLDEDDYEYNAGLGYRHVLGNDQVMLGGYLYYDRLETEYDNSFTQYTLGLELQTRRWRLHLNHYEPKDDDGQALAPAETNIDGSLEQTPRLTWEDSQLYFVTPGGIETVSQWREYALGGQDVNVSYRAWGDEDRSLWMSAGYYRFTGKGLPDVDGPRARVEWQSDIPGLPRGSRIELGLEWQKDDLRNDQTFITAGLHIPLGKSGRKTGRDHSLWFEQRMTDRPERDIDIITAEANRVIERREVASARESVIYADGPWAGTPVGSVHYVDATGGGDGSAENPTDLSTALDNSGGNSVILLEGDLPGDINIDSDNLRVLGGDTGFRVAGSETPDLLATVNPNGNADFTGTVTFGGSGIDVQGVDFSGGLILDSSGDFTLTDSQAGNVQLLGGEGAVNFHQVDFSGLHANDTSASFTHHSGSLMRSDEGFIVDILGASDTEFNFNAGLDASDSASGIRIRESSGTGINFGGNAISLDTTGNALTLENNTNTHTRFTQSVMIQADTSAIAATQGGELSLLSEDNHLGAGGPVLAITDAHITLGASTLTGAGLSLNNVTGSLSAATTELTGALNLNDADGNFDFGDTTLTGGGLHIDNASGQVNFVSLDLNDVAGDGVLIEGNKGEGTAAQAGGDGNASVNLPMINLGALSLDNITGDGLVVSGNYAIVIDSLDMNTIGGSGMVFADATGSLTAGTINITDIGDTGADFTDANIAFTADSLNINGGVTAIDLTRSRNTIHIINGGNLSGFSRTGVQISRTDRRGDAAGSRFTFGGGLINARPGAYVIDAIGINESLGRFNFTGARFRGDFRLDIGEGDAPDGLYFVGGSATGAGDGSSSDDLADIGTAQTFAGTGEEVTFVFVNSEGSINVSGLTGGSFVLSDNQTIASFNDDHTSTIGLPRNLIGNFGNLGLTDPTGTGTATLTGGANPIIILGSNNRISDINLDNAGLGFSGINIDGLIVDEANFTTITGPAFYFENISGDISLSDLGFTDSDSFLAVDGSTANIDASGVNFDGSMILANIQGQSDGTIQLGSLSSSNGTSLLPLISSINQTGGTLSINSIAIDNFSGAANAISLSGNGDVNIGSLNIHTTTGGGLAANGVNLGVTNGQQLISDSGTALSLTNVTSTGINLGDVTATGGAGAGIVLDTVTGSLTFGDINLTGNGTSGIILDGTDATITADTIAVTNPAVAGILFSGFDGTFTADSFNQDGGVTGLDLTNAGGTITFNNGGVLQNFTGTGVQFSSTDNTADSANATFVFGGGSITATGGATVMDGIGLDPTLGTYDFTGVAFSGSFDFPAPASQVGDLFFVGSTATGSGDGSSVDNLSDVDDAQTQANTTDPTTFVFVNDGSAIDMSGLTGSSFTLSDGQVISGFGNGNSFGVEVPANLIGDFSMAGINDPTGNGAANLTTTGAPVITVGSNNLVENINLGNANGGFYGANITDLTLGGLNFNTISGFALDFDTIAGTFDFSDLSFTDSDGYLNIDTSSADINAAGVDFTQATSPFSLVNIANQSGGTITLGSFTSSGNTAADGVFASSNQTGGSLILQGLTVTGYNSAGNTAINLSGSATANLGAVNITTTAGSGLSVSGLNLAINSGSSITATDGQALNLTNINLSSPVNFSNITSTGSTTSGINLNDVSGSELDIDQLQISGTTGNGLVLNNLAGNLVVDNASFTNIGGTALTANTVTGDLTFGDTLINATGGDGMIFNSVSGTSVFGNIDIADATDTGVDFGGHTGTFTATSLDIDGGTDGIDLSDAEGNITITNGGVIENFSANGVQFSGSDTTATTADATFVFGGGSITAGGGAYVMDGIGLDPSAGSYDFTGVTFSGNFDFAPGAGQVGELFFVAASATGDGSGSNLNNMANVGDAQTQADTGDLTTFVFVDDGNTIDLGAGGFTLNNNQVVAGFGNGAAFGLIVPANLIGDFGDVSYEDPFGNGAATLSTSGSTLFTLADDNLIQNVDLGSGNYSIVGNGIADLTVTGTSATTSGGYLFDFTNTTGTIDITDNDFTLTGGLITVDGGTADMTLSQGAGANFSGTGVAVSGFGGTLQVNDFTRTAASGTAFEFDNNTGTIGFNNLTINRQNGDTVFAIDQTTGGSTGAISITGTSTVSAAEGSFLLAGSGARDINLGTLDITGTTTGANALVNISGQSGGTITLGNITSSGSTGAGILVSSGATAGSLVTGNINIDGFDSAGNTVVSLNGQNTITLGNISIDAISGNVLDLSDTDLTLGTVSLLDTQSGQALNLTDINLSGNTTIASLTSIDSATTGITLDNVTGGNLDFTQVTVTDAAGVGLNFIDTTGTLDFGTGSSISGSGGNAFAVSGGDATITYDGDITQSGNTLLRVINTTGGSVSLGTGDYTQSGGSGIDIQSTAGNVSLGGNSVTLGSAGNELSGDAININNASGTVTVNNADMVTGAGVTGIDINNGSGNLTLSGSLTQNSGGQAVDITGGNRNVNMSGLTITNDGTTGSGVINVSGTTGGTVSFGDVAITNAANNIAVNLSNSGNVSFNDLDITGTGGTGLNVDTLGALTINGGTVNITNALGVYINGTGPGTNATFDSVTVNNNSGGGVDLNAVTGSVAFTNLALTTTAGIGFDASNVNTLTITGGTIGTSNALGLNITNAGVGSSVNLDSLTANNNAGGGVNLANNQGNYEFGGLYITNTNGTGLLVNNSGTLAITGTDNTLNSTTGTALRVTDTTIGVAGLNFQSVTSSGSNNGIYLNNTGSGGLAISGTGTTVGSGGTISNTTETGIVLIDTRNVSINGMIVNTTGDHGISGSGVTAATPGSNGNAFTFSHGSVLNAGNSLDDNGIYFGDQGTNVNNFSDQFTVNTVMFDNYAENGIYLENWSSSADVNILNSQFQNATDAENDQAILINSLSGSSASFDVTVSGSTFGTPFGSPTNGICCSGLWWNAQGSGSHSLLAQNNTFQNISFASSGQGIVVSTAQTASMTVDITDNDFIDLDAANVGLSILDGSTMTGVINDNDFSGPNIDGFAVNIVGDSAGTANAFTGIFTIDNNTISADGAAIRVLSRDSTNPAAIVHVNITNNTITGQGNGQEIVMLNSLDDASLCGNITGNTIVKDSGIFDEIGLLASGSQNMRIAQTNSAAMEAANGGAVVFTNSGGFTYSSNCLTPP